MSITLVDLSKRYGAQLIVSRISAEIETGELFVLLGSSGSGKSTVLRMIAGLTVPDEGRIELEGRDVTFEPPQTRGIGFVFQNYSVFRHMSAAQNVQFGLRIRNVPAAERKRKTEELLELVGLAGLGDRLPGQMSGGQQQRIALARALAYNPTVLLLDEPFGALDVGIRSQLRASLKQIQRRLKVTTILVTHDQEEAFELADRIGVLEHGRLVEVGTPDNLYHRPSSEYAASFVGNGNVLVGRIEAGRIRLGKTVWPFPEHTERQEEGSPVRVLFRPETVVLAPRPNLEEEGALPLGTGRVTTSIFAGSSVRLRLEVSGLEGVRPLAPPRPYGQDKTIIEALMPSVPLPRELMEAHKVWVGVRSFHVLRREGLRFLAYWDETPEAARCAELTAWLAEVSKGHATLLACVEGVQRATALDRHLQSFIRGNLASSSRVEGKARPGSWEEEIILEAQQGEHDIVVLPHPSSSPLAAFDNVARALFEIVGIPILFAGEGPVEVRRMLICTAVGEPGKADVGLGGRLARHMQARVVILHLHPPNAPQESVDRARSHLQQAAASLEGLGLRCETKLQPHAVALDGITQEVVRGEHDMVVIGAPGPRDPRRLNWAELTGQIVQQVARSVLVVPLGGGG